MTSFYIPYVNHRVDKMFMKHILDGFGWGTITSIEMNPNGNAKCAIINYAESTPQLKQISDHLYYYQQIKIQYSPYEFWWFKPNLYSSKVPKNLTIVHMPLVLNIDLNAEDSDSEDEE